LTLVRQQDRPKSPDNKNHDNCCCAALSHRSVSYCGDPVGLGDSVDRWPSNDSS
jgi:hypothetical protein